MSGKADGPAIVASGLCCRKGTKEVLKDVSLQIEQGCFLGILGPNGCGKTTLLRCLAGLDRPSGGELLLEGEPVFGLSPAAIARRLALQGQDAEAALGFSVRDVVSLGRLAHRRSFLSGDDADDIAKVEQAISQLELESFAGRAVETLSGGERQRVMIARALAQEPQILLLDEPTNHLDIQHRFAVLKLVRSLGITVVAVLHDIELAARHCDRIVLMKQGRVVADGTPQEALTANHLRDVFSVAAAIDTHPVTGRMRIALEPLAVEEER
ncbi:ABC transporter ATP-binding protein [Methyloligella sp. 2.7D]|uniref:ABC transporter ATP-binding protein n=1 Tax=unclassified Methyloligella TaxID=2625955 RepID=UPI00157DA0B9|nr:ABC transporter ATP-binding protein [Methyloligella sp. GL2]QKP78232.1 ABC transporter ATP-binding protein [Methyloligella sp. GL2]